MRGGRSHALLRGAGCLRWLHRAHRRRGVLRSAPSAERPSADTRSNTPRPPEPRRRPPWQPGRTSRVFATTAKYASDNQAPVGEETPPPGNSVSTRDSTDSKPHCTRCSNAWASRASPSRPSTRPSGTRGWPTRAASCSKRPWSQHPNAPPGRLAASRLHRHVSVLPRARRRRSTLAEPPNDRARMRSIAVHQFAFWLEETERSHRGDVGTRMGFDRTTSGRRRTDRLGSIE